MSPYRLYSSDEEKCTIYNHRVRLAEQQNDKWHKVVRKYIRRYEAVASTWAKTADGHNVGVPVGISIIDSLYSSLTAVEVDLSVVAKGHATDDQAYVASGALSQEWGITKAAQRSDEAVKDALLGGIGAVKVGYDFYEEEQDLPVPEEERKAELVELYRQRGQAAAQGIKNLPDDEEIEGSVPMKASQKVTISDRIVVDYVPWDMLLWDPTAKRWGDCEWVAQKTMMSPQEMRENPLFKEYVAGNRQTKKLRELKADSTIDKSVLGEFSDVTKDDERFTVYTFWDFKTGTVCTFAKGADFLLNESANSFAINDDFEDMNPFVPLILRHSPGRVRGVSEMEVMEDGLNESDMYHSRLGTYLERVAPKVIAMSRAFTPAGKKAMKSQEYGAVVELAEGHGVEEVIPFNPPTLMSEMYGMSEKIEDALRDATGMNELMRGLFPDRKRTATETTEVVSASAARQAEKRMALERFYKGIARRMLQLMQMNYEAERVVRLVDEAGEVAWDWSAEDIVFDFDLEINLTPKEAKSWQARQDKALSVLNVIAPLAAPGPDGSSPVDMTELLRYVLTELALPRKMVSQLLNLPEEKQKQVMETLQKQAAQAQAGAGQVPSPAMVPGPLDAKSLAVTANMGELPPEVIAAAQGSGPTSPMAAEQVSETMGASGT